jgi:hypothetical protein
MFRRVYRRLQREAKEWVERSEDPRRYLWERKHAPRLNQFKNRHRNEDCFIIGNGPSLNKMDLAPLRDCHTIGMNKIFLIFDRVDLNLSYHTSVNKLVIEQSAREFEKLNCPSFVSFRQIEGQFPAGPNIFPIWTSAPAFTFATTLLTPIYEGWTVTYVALQIAYAMGFRRVFLIGVDHSFQAQGKPNEKQVLQGDDPNHFAPNYFGGKAWNLPDLEGSEMAYRVAKFFYERDHREVYDATVDGKLTIFPKMSYEEALETAARKSSRGRVLSPASTPSAD